MHRSTWTRGRAERTDWQTADSKLYRKEDGKPLRFFERTLKSSLLDPIPNEGILNSDRMQASVKDVSAGSEKLPCIVLMPRSQSPRANELFKSAGDRYCFQASSGALLVSTVDFISTEYRHIVTMQDRYLAREIDILVGSLKALSVTVDSVDSFSPTDAIFSPPGDAVPSTQETTNSQLPPPSGRDGPGTLARKTFPRYPIQAKAARVQGIVLLGVTITSKGKVKDIDVLETPDDSLASAAVDAVRQWQYRPFLLNGVPVQTEEVVRVYFVM